MKIAYYIPNPETIYAGRTILNGYLNAWRALGHQASLYTPDLDLKSFFEQKRPDIFITGLSRYYLKYISIEALISLKKAYNTKIFVSLPFWKSPISRLRLNETPSLADQKELVDILREGQLGDAYTSICPQSDMRMDGFTKVTGQSYSTVLLAADITVLTPQYNQKFESDISFVGTYLPEKRKIFRDWVNPLSRECRIRYYGQDWTTRDRLVSWVCKLGQYYDIGSLRSLQKAKLSLEEEAQIYTSSTVSINIHEEYQKKYGNDCNERTFKIPASKGFQIVDDVACIRSYFKENEEIVIAKDKYDFQEKVRHYLKYPEERLPIIQMGYNKVVSEHTYHHRVKQLIGIYSNLQ